MAATTEALAGLQQIASMIPQEDIPIKLRCTICNKLATNAYRTPCCDSSICENCQSSLPAACPICDHTPLSADDCKPNKALRTTVKVFLRTEERKRDIVKDKSQSHPAPSLSVPPTPTTPLEPSARPEASHNLQPNVGGSKATSVNESAVQERPLTDAQSSSAPQEDIPRPSIENVDKGQELDESKQQEADGKELEQAQAGEKGKGQDDQRVRLPNHGDLWGGVSNQEQLQAFGNAGYGLNGMGNGFNNMGWNGQAGFDAMEMQNGMATGGWGAFPNMMGMPGMQMDPMSMPQGMYGGYGGQGMGMGMGIGFDAGQSGYDSWNGQNTWSGSQDKFNPNAHGGFAGGVGDFGSNSGFQPAAGGYNEPSHGDHRQMHHQQYPNHNYQNGGQAHGFHPTGRGGGRGSGQNQNQNQNQNRGHGPLGNNQALVQQHSTQPQRGIHSLPETSDAAGVQTSMPMETAAKQLTAGEATGPAEAQGEAEGKTHTVQGDSGTSGDGTGPSNPADSLAGVKVGPASSASDGTMVKESVPTGSDGTLPSTSKPDGIREPTTVVNGVQPPSGPAALTQGDGFQHFSVRGRGSSHGFYRGAPGFRGRGAGPWNGAYPTGNPSAPSGPRTDLPGVVPVEPKGLGVVGAPKAPKALREGLPNTGIRGRGFAILGRGGAMFNGGGHAAMAKTKSPSPERRKTPSRSRSPEETRSRHGRRHRRKDSRREDDGDGNSTTKQTVRDSPEDEFRSRSRSPGSSKRSSRRSRHDKDGASSYGDRDSHRSQRDRSRERRHRRKRSRSGSRGGDDERLGSGSAAVTNGVKPTSSGGTRRNNRDRDRKLSRHERPRSGDRAEEKHAPGQSRRSKHDDKRRGDARREQDRNSMDEDHHTREREARNRERLQKEQQRRDELTKEREGNDREWKRPREADGGGVDDGDEERVKRRRHKTGHGRRGTGNGEDGGVSGDKDGGRRVSYKYVEDEGEEARALRVENEREAARWG